MPAIFYYGIGSCPPQAGGHVRPLCHGPPDRRQGDNLVLQEAQDETTADRTPQAGKVAALDEIRRSLALLANAPNGLPAGAVPRATR